MASTPRRRWNDRSFHKIGPWLVATVAFAMAAYALYGWEKESNSRQQLAMEVRDQNCDWFEGQHFDDVQVLKERYEYLRSLPREEWGGSVPIAVLRTLPAIERRARKDAAPDYCDEPNLGRPEPDPKLPERRDFSNRAIPQD